MRKNTIKRAGDSIVLKHKILDREFNNDIRKYKDFTHEFIYKQGPLDINFELISALALSLFRTIIVVSSLPEHAENPILKFNPNVEKPPYILGLYFKSNLKFLDHILLIGTQILM